MKNEEGISLKVRYISQQNDGALDQIRKFFKTDIKNAFNLTFLISKTYCHTSNYMVIKKDCYTVVDTLVFLDYIIVLSKYGMQSTNDIFEKYSNTDKYIIKEFSDCYFNKFLINKNKIEPIFKSDNYDILDSLAENYSSDTLNGFMNELKNSIFLNCFLNGKYICFLKNKEIKPIITKSENQQLEEICCYFCFDNHYFYINVISEMNCEYSFSTFRAINDQDHPILKVLSNLGSF
jgi:hypothetical protein